MKRAWQIPKIWDGGEVWILGGGPSLLECFDIPNELALDVRYRKKGIEAYSPYLAKIHGKHIIGINVAYQFGSWVDICFFGDKGFFFSHEHGMSQHKGLVVSSSEYVAKKNLHWVKYTPFDYRTNCKSDERNFGISSHEKAVRWNFNSGSSAISLAAWLGAKRIVLVGFDMTLSKTDNQHFHNEYKKVGGKIEPKKLPFNKHMRGFPYIKKDADAMGIEIINTSLNSAIKDFPKVHIKELL